MGFIAEAKRKNLWFGTEEKMEWFKTPSRGADASPVGWGSDGTTLNGGGYAFSSFGSHKQYQFDWGSSNARRVAQRMKSYADGTYGRGYIYFVDPTIYDHNILPANWADPSMGIGYEGSSLVHGVIPTGVPTGSNPNDLPVTAALFNLNGISSGFRGKQQAVFIPIPEGHTLSLGAMYSYTGSGGVFASPVLATGAIGPEQRLTTLGVGASAIVADSFSGIRGVWLWVGKTSAANASVTIHGMTARLMTDVEAETYEITRNLFTNPNLVGSGSWVELGRNLFTNPRLVGDGTWAEVRRNKVLNPVFSAGTGHWQVNPSTTALSHDPAKGSHSSGSARIEQIAATGGMYLVNALTGSGRVPVVAGELTPGAVSLWYEPSGRTLRIYAIYYNTAGSQLTAPIIFDEPLAGSASWQEFRFSHTPPAEAASVRYQITLMGSQVGDVAWIGALSSGTDVLFNPDAPLGSVDPDMRQRWLGAENASESVMEGERVRGLTAVRCAAIRSTRNGKPAVRLVSTGGLATETSFAAITGGLPAAARAVGTFLGTLHADRVSDGLQGWVNALRAANPAQLSTTTNNAGSFPHRLDIRGNTDGAQVAVYGDGAASTRDTWWTDLALFAGDYRYPWLGGEDLSTLDQPEDFRTRWTGAVDNSEMVLEIEKVRGLTASNCAAGVSTKAGKPAVRLIPTKASPYTSAYFSVPAAARTLGTLIGTVHQDSPVQPPLAIPNERVANLLANSPEQRSSGYVNASGSRQRRLVFSSLTGTYQVFLYHGGTQGSGDVWWTDIALVAGDYDGPAFSGSSPQNGTTHYKWAGTPNNSESISYYQSAKADQISRGPWVGGMGHSGCRFVGKPTFIENGPDWTGFSATFKEVVN